MLPRLSFVVVVGVTPVGHHIIIIIIIIVTVKTYRCHMDPYPASLGRRT